MFDIATYFITIVTQLRQAVAAYAAAQARPVQVVWLGDRAFVPISPPERLPRLPDASWTLLWHRLGRLASRFQTLVDRWRANALPARVPARRPPAAQAARSDRGSQPRLPGTLGWVHHRIPDSASPSGRLHELLTQPDTQALVLAAPQAGRLLRPLCRALGVPLPAWLALPARPRPARRPVVAPCTLTPPGAPPGPPPTPDRPIPANILAAARAWKKRGF